MTRRPTPPQRSNPVGDALATLASAVIIVPVLIIEGVFGIFSN